MCCLLIMVDLCCSHLNIFLSLIPWSFQLMDLSEVFLSTDIEFVKTALSQPEGSVQAICVPGGAVRTKLMCLLSTFDHDSPLLTCHSCPVFYYRNCLVGKIWIS